MSETDRLSDEDERPSDAKQKLHFVRQDRDFRRLCLRVHTSHRAMDGRTDGPAYSTGGRQRPLKEVGTGCEKEACCVGGILVEVFQRSSSLCPAPLLLLKGPVTTHPNIYFGRSRRARGGGGGEREANLIPCLSCPCCRRSRLSLSSPPDRPSDRIDVPKACGCEAQL